MPIPHKLILFPCNGNAIEALDCIDPGQWEVIGFVDDSADKIGKEVCGVWVYDRSLLNEHPGAKVLAVPGSPTSFPIRDTIIDGLELPADRFATVVHPTSRVSKHATIGRNILLMEGVTVKASATIGDHVCILPHSVIHHDSSIGDYTLMGSNVVVAGYTQVGSKCYIGSGSRIINNISIGEEALVGMGSNVLKNIPSKDKVAGNPAKSLLA